VTKEEYDVEVGRNDDCKKEGDEKRGRMLYVFIIPLLIFPYIKVTL
jgi:hypothetical protein